MAGVIEGFRWSLTGRGDAPGTAARGFRAGWWL